MSLKADIIVELSPARHRLLKIHILMQDHVADLKLNLNRGSPRWETEFLDWTEQKIFVRLINTRLYPSSIYELGWFAVAFLRSLIDCRCCMPWLEMILLCVVDKAFGISLYRKPELISMLCPDKILDAVAKVHHRCAFDIRPFLMESDPSCWW